jgi:hypothetical protein
LRLSPSLAQQRSAAQPSHLQPRPPPQALLLLLCGALMAEREREREKERKKEREREIEREGEREERDTKDL